MIDRVKLKEALDQYKAAFATQQWNDEAFKWEAVQCFQDHWDINAVDFADMLKRSLAQTNNLLVAQNHFPRAMLQRFAETAPEEVRAMFLSLFDEKRDVVARILAFKEQAGVLLDKYGNGAKQHYQYENAVSTYLWLRFPDKYYIYKYVEVKAISKKLNSDYTFKKGAYTENLRNFYSLYNEIRAELLKDDELIALLHGQLTDSCYPDPALCTLTIDVCFFISRSFEEPIETDEIEEQQADWWPKTYTPGLSTEDWLALLNDPKVFTDRSLEIMKRILNEDDQATCKQLALKYGETVNFYISGSSSLAKRIVKKTGCPIMPREEGGNRWWTVLYLGKAAQKNDPGTFVWKLRDELAAALRKTDLSNVRLYAKQDAPQERHYWWLNANPKIWSLTATVVGTEQSYTLYNESGHKRRVFQNFLDAKVGDPIIGYESNPVKQVVALAEVSAEQDGEKIGFKKTESLTSPISYAELKECPELEHMEYFQNPQGSLFRLSEDEYNFILDLIRENNPLSKQIDAEKYSKSDFLRDVYLNEAQYDTLVSLLRYKKNVILQGAPGVGKTYAAKRLAWSLLGKQDENHIVVIQFHQNYSYEDFMMGYRPVSDGFELQYGVFYQFCKKAADHPDEEFFFIIDEINRGNLSKIFGELLMLIERDYRGKPIVMAYNGVKFSVPDNLYLIGMMNTADRSLAMIDYALRRRFSFFELEPEFSSEGFRRYQDSLDNETFDLLISKIQELNVEIARDPSLGKGFCIGHSYFCNQTVCSDTWMRGVVEYDILPMLREYWFDDDAKVQKWENSLRGVFQ